MRTRLLLPLFLLIGTLALAQSFRGGINGTITDKTGASVPTSDVTITNQETGLTRTVTTDDAGNYSIPELPIGTYTIVVKKPGFRSETLTNVAVAVSANTAANIILQTGQVNETVQVTAAPPLIETTSDTLGGTIQGEQAAQLPVNGGDFIKLLTLVPGATGDPSQAGDSPGSFGLFSVNGSRGRSNNYLLDGTDMNDGYRNLPAINEAGVFGTPAVILPIEAIAEVPVISGAEAEYGRNSGAIVNLVTRSGTNDLHGSVYEFFRNNALDARNFFNAKPIKQDAFHNNQFGGSLGGKIIRDKTFFFFSYEGQREHVGIPSIATVPSDVDIAKAIADNGGVINPVIAALLARHPFPTPNLGGDSLEASTLASNRVDSVIGKIDQMIGKNNTISGRYFFGDSDQSFPFALLGGNVLPGNNTVTPTRVQVLSLSATRILSPRLLLEVRGGWNRYAQRFLPEDHTFNPNSIGLNTTTNPQDFGLPIIAISGFAGLGASGSVPRGRVDTNWQYFTNLSYSTGAHSYKFGYEFRRTFVDGFFDAGHRGKLSFNSLKDFVAGNITGTSSQSVGYTTRDSFQNNHDVYAQDSWKLSRKLTLNYGLRWDYYGVIGEQRHRFSIFDKATDSLVVPKQLYPRDLNNFSPRVSIAYDLTGSGKTVLRAGWGIFYDAFSQDFFVGQLPLNTSNAGVAYNNIGPAPILFSSSPVATIVAGQPVFPATSFTVSDISTVDQRVRTPYYENYNLNVQHQLTSYAALDVAYVGSVGRKLFRFLDINQANPTTGQRPFPNNTIINELQTSASSNYNSLQTSLKMIIRRRLDATFNYTWSHSIDDASDGQEYVPNASQPDNSFNPKGNRASSNFDTRHRFTGYLTYNFADRSFLPRLSSGWSINSVVTHSTGQPFTVNYLFEGDFNGTGEFYGRPDLVGNPFAGRHTPFQYLNAAAFQVPCTLLAGSTSKCVPGTSHFGNLPRNSFNGPAYTDLDLSLAKNTKLGERLTMQLRIDAFNILNHPNFSNPLLPSFGVDFAGALTPDGHGVGFVPITATPDVGPGNPFLGGGGPRNLQLSARFSF